ncbi:MAG: hypothetical protein ABIK53_05465 [bacterium]
MDIVPTIPKTDVDNYTKEIKHKQILQIQKTIDGIYESAEKGCQVMF